MGWILFTTLDVLLQTRYMKKILLLLLAILSIATTQAQKSTKRELRGAWISTVGGLDWPARGASTSSQKAALITILDHHKATGINTIYFQCRSSSDALYQSNIEPWSWDLTGVQGKAPSPYYDPLQFAIDESRKRGFEFHAWINPFRAVTSTSNLSDTNRYKPNCIAKTHPEWLLTFGTVQILNPGIPAVRAYVTSVVMDIVRRYDIDGIHFDDYFYLSATVPDDSTYLADPRSFPNTTAGKQDWRRDNINIFIRGLNDSIKAAKPWVKFGVAPSGIYRSSTNPAIGSNTSSGASQHYSTAYADTKKWLQNGWVDYIAPQVYWFIGQTGSDYNILIPWWNNNAFGRHIYIGMAAYKVGDAAQSSDANWLTDRTQIPRQVRMNRDALYPNVIGEIYFRTQNLVNNRLNFRDSLRLRYYTKPALLPTMPWRDSIAPAAASNLTATRFGNDSVVLHWTKPAFNGNELDRIRQFVVYRSTNPVININDTSNIIAITPNDTTGFRNTGLNAASNYYYTVTSVDRMYNESVISNVVADRAPTITCPGSQSINLDSACTAYVPDFTGLATTANASTVTQSPEPLTAINGTGNYTVTLTATNLVGQTASCSFTLVAHDVRPPVVSANNPSLTNGGSINFSTDAGQCSFTAGTQLDVTGTDNCSSSLNYSYTITSNGNTSAAVSSNTLNGVVFAKGTSVVNWTVTDESNNSSSYSYTVNVTDNEAPVISGVYADPSVLWAPNHKLRAVTVNYTVTDNCGSATSSISVASNEAQSTPRPDWVVLDNHHLKLRAERDGNGSGRIYTITITATDAAGNVSTQTTNVTVPHDEGAVTFAKPKATAEVTGLKLNVAPNPSSHQFTIIPSSSSASRITIRVTNAAGRVVEKRGGLAANTAIVLGANYLPGTYFVEVEQGDLKQTFKVIKR
jgi:uncharacterized lipoprotein YddW (UPF0748 family)